jgi:GNAT superfamily N-acetyltransferase
LTLKPIDRDDPEVQPLYADFVREADGPLVYDRKEAGMDLDEEIAAGPPADLVPPNGVFLIARVDGEPAGLGGVRHLDTEVAEVKSMYVAPAYRGTGLGRRILDRLNEIAEGGLRVDRGTTDMDLKVEMAAGAGRVAGFADRTDTLTLPDELSPVDTCRPREVGVEVAPLLPFTMDQDVVAVEDGVEPGPQDLSVAHRDELGPASGGYVEAFVDAAAAARRVIFPDRPTYSMRPLNRENVAIVGNPAIATGDLGKGRPNEAREREENYSGEALQWCSITRSTMLYSFASSALMK